MTLAVMMPSSSFVVIAVLLTIGVIFEQQILIVSGFEFDHDVDVELCRKEIAEDSGICVSNSTMWFSCPISCAWVLHGGMGTMAEERTNPEQFYELRVEKMHEGASNKGTDTSLENNEGYITMYAVLPMLPGMTEYYYRAIEHIAQVYKYTLVAMILPYYDTTENKQDDTSPISILKSIVGSQAGEAKSILLTGYDARQKTDNEVLEYLLSRDAVAGTLDPENHGGSDENDNTLLITRLNVFLVSHTGMFIERVVSPTMEIIERRIKVHEIAMEHNFEL